MLSTLAYGTNCIRVINSGVESINLFDLCDYLLGHKHDDIQDIIPAEREIMICYNQSATLENRLALQNVLENKLF